MAQTFSGYLARGVVLNGVFTETSGATGYARQPVAFQGINGQARNNAPVIFRPTLAAWPAANGLAIYDNVTGGQPLLWWQWDGIADLPAGGSQVILAGQLQLQGNTPTTTAGLQVYTSGPTAWAGGIPIYNSSEAYLATLVARIAALEAGGGNGGTGGTGNGGTGDTGGGTTPSGSEFVTVTTPGSTADTGGGTGGTGGGTTPASPEFVTVAIPVETPVTDPTASELLTVAIPADSSTTAPSTPEFITVTNPA